MLFVLCAALVAASGVNYKYSKTMSPVIDVEVKDGQRAAVAGRDLLKGAMVLAVLTDQPCVTMAVSKLMKVPGVHKVSSAVLMQEGADGNGETPYRPLHQQEEDEAFSRFALGYELAQHHATWGNFSGGMIATTLNNTDGLLSAYQSEIEALRNVTSTWWAVYDKTRDVLLAQLTKEDFEWAGVVLRARGMPSPYREMVGEWTMYFRQHHSKCVEVELQEAAGTFLVGVTTEDVKQGQELCISYTKNPSRQQLLIQYGIVDEAAQWGINYYIGDGDIEADPSVLGAHACEAGELLLTPSHYLTKTAFYCFMLHQIPQHVRHSYKDLLRGRTAKDEAYVALATAVNMLLADHYNATKAEGVFDIDAIIGLETEKRRQVVVEQDDMPEMLKDLIKKQQPVDTESVHSSALDVSEKEEQPVAVSNTSAPLSPVVALLNSQLSEAVAPLKEFHSVLHSRWVASQETAMRHRREEIQARNELVMEQARRALEEYELSKGSEESE